MATFEDLWNVQNDGGAALVLKLLGGKLSKIPGGNAVPVFSLDGRPLVVKHGNASFVGNNGDTQNVAVAHELGFAPVNVSITPALSSGGVWTCAQGQYQAADIHNFYMRLMNPGAGFVPGFLNSLTYFFNWRVEGVLPT